MTTAEKKEIIAYLQGPRNYTEGVRLYERYGHNRMYKRRFAIEDTAFLRQLLVEELRKLSGLSEAEFRKLPRLARQVQHPKKSAPAATEDKAVPDTESELQELADSFDISVEELVSLDFQERVLAMDENKDRIDELTEELSRVRKKYEEAPEPVRRMISFRDKYSFLKQADCPDILKVLVADMFTAYDTYKQAFADLQTIPDDNVAEAAKTAEEVVSAYLTNKEIWEELEYYRTTGRILGKAAKIHEMEAREDLTALTDLELAKKLNSARTNQSKRAQAVKEAEEAGADTSKALEALNRWTATRENIEAEIERRKKSK